MLREISMLRWRIRLAVFAVILPFGLLFGGGAIAQDQSGMSPERIQQLMKSLSPEQQQKIQQLQAQQATSQGGSVVQSGPVVPSGPVELKPSAGARRTGGRSKYEQLMSKRAGASLQQFGYDQVGVGRSISVPQMGALQDSYVLGPGDEVDVVLRGQENSQFSVTVDRNGQIVLPRLAPLGAAGRTLGDFRRALQDAVHRAYVSTDADVAIGQLRQATVLVSGEVNNPGTQIVTASSTVLDAILLSGGVRKSGTLRDIKLVRGGKTISVDLYGVLTRQGSGRLPNLQDGDRILVPPIGTTVAVSGYVRRPGIYELPAGQSSISAAYLMALGNGPQQRGEIRSSIARIMPDGKVQFVDVTAQNSAVLRDGEVLVVAPIMNKSEGRVTLAGAVRTPGVFPVERYKTLHDLLQSKETLQDGAYVLFGFIDRIDPGTLQHSVIVFSPLHVMQGKQNIDLISDDTVHLMTIAGIKSLLRGRLSRMSLKDNGQGLGEGDLGEDVSTDEGDQDSTGDTLDTSTNQSTGNGQAAGDTASTGGAVGGEAGGTNAVTTAGATAVGGESAAGGEAAANGADDGGVAAGSAFGKKLTDYQFTLSGAVQKPGTYLAADGTTLADVLSVFGGLTQDVDLSNFEVTSTIVDNDTGVATTQRASYQATPEQLGKIILRPYDAILFRRVYSDRETGSVTIRGEVRYPGRYTILRGEKLSSVLARAGGLTEVAYPYGTVFLRQAAAKREAEVNHKLAADIRSQLFMVLLHPNTSTNASSSVSPESIVALQSLLTQIESTHTLGRVAMVADPAFLAAHPGDDPLLAPGDSITIPKRPVSVSVLGEVMQPGSMPTRESWSAQDYIDAAGGYSQFADKDRIIIVLPDGRAYVADQGSWLNFDSDKPIPPGSSIVVARDITSLSSHQFFVDTIQIFSTLATTAAALAVLARY